MDIQLIISWVNQNQGLVAIVIFVLGVIGFFIKKLSKIWAFNRINSGDSKANMINITPVFYNLELGNKTSVQIINQTELLINATK